MSATDPARHKASRIATVPRVTSGNFLEMFDFFLFGGFTPLVSTSLIQATGNKAAPGMWMAFAGARGLI